jgi:hypothetical protein
MGLHYDILEAWSQGFFCWRTDHTGYDYPSEYSKRRASTSVGSMRGMRAVNSLDQVVSESIVSAAFFSRPMDLRLWPRSNKSDHPSPQ